MLFTRKEVAEFNCNQFYLTILHLELIQQTIYSYQDGLSNLNKKQIDRVKQLYRDSVHILSQIDQLSSKNLTEYRYRKFGKFLHATFPWPERLTRLKFIKESPVNSTSKHISYMAISDTCLLGMTGGGLHNRPPCKITGELFSLSIVGYTNRLLLTVIISI